jgi:hypothetical protein
MRISGEHSTVDFGKARFGAPNREARGAVAMNLEGRIKKLEGTAKSAPRIIFWDRDKEPMPAIEGDCLLVRWLSKSEDSSDPMFGTEGERWDSRKG